MVFGFNKGGRPKKIKVEENQEDDIEDADDETKDEDLDDEEQEKEEELKNLNSKIRKLKSDKQIVKPSARIVSGKIVGDGIYEFTLITNTNLGQIGEEFDI